MREDSPLARKLVVRPTRAARAFAREVLKAGVNLTTVALVVGVAELDDVVGLGVAAAIDGGWGGAHCVGLMNGVGIREGELVLVLGCSNQGKQGRACGISVE